MSVSAPRLGVPTDTWTSASAGFNERIEVVDGELTIRRIGGNPHHYIAQRLAQEFEAQWERYATAPGNWAITLAPDGSVLQGRIPDVLVNGESLITDEVYRGTPDAAVEVWSPGNTLGEMNDKRAQYRTAGLPVLLEAYLTDGATVHLEWLTNAGTHWASAAVAAGDSQLTVPANDLHPAFSVVPNALLRRPGT
ncbi:hypothetical protein GTQ99_09280 [Kineococcus sp. T13]|uniref:Uma2 family endonuclease n=1 Tax=Kineococcus vitellinus TaxID=2696565 RepID=UPI001413029F|nr:Uma2 family endonuclease [Kineococcus vitellinus]NAZ75609.1 hypothetical protein [Kineococcus vitellinus]